MGKTDKMPERIFNYRVYEEQGKVVSEQTTKLLLDDDEIESSLEQVRINIKRTEEQKKLAENALAALRKEEKALLDYLKTKKPIS